MRRVLVTCCIAVLCFACGNKTASTPQTTSPTSTKPADVADWIPFKGSAATNGDQVQLTADNGDAFEMDAKDVKVSGTDIQVKANADAHTVKHAGGGTRPANAIGGDCHKQDDCPSHCASCIGLVRVCCGGGGTRGFCLGAYGCP